MTYFLFAHATCSIALASYIKGPEKSLKLPLLVLLSDTLSTPDLHTHLISYYLSHLSQAVMSSNGKVPDAWDDDWVIKADVSL